MRAFLWVVINSVFAYALYKGQTVPWAATAFIAFVWFMFLVMISVSVSDKSKTEYRKFKPSVPMPLDVLYDVVMISALIYYGWYFIAFIYAVTMILVVWVRLERHKEINVEIKAEGSELLVEQLKHADTQISLLAALDALKKIEVITSLHEDSEHDEEVNKIANNALKAYAVSHKEKEKQNASKN